MTSMVRQWGSVVAALVSLAAVSAFFGTRCLGALAHLSGQHAYRAGQYERAWSDYQRARRLSGDSEDLDLDQVETLIHGLEVSEAGFKVKPALPSPEGSTQARALLLRILERAPYRAYFWSLAGDLYFDAARERRRSTALDLSALSDDPLKNLLPEEGLGFAAYQAAASREPTNYVYQELQTEEYLSHAALAPAAAHVRLGLADYPVLDSHAYLGANEIAPEVVDAAIAGFADALRSTSMVAGDSILLDMGRLLMRVNRPREALPYFKMARDRNPHLADEPFEAGTAEFWLGDYQAAAESLETAVRELPEQPWAHFYLGRALLSLHRDEEGIESMRRARQLDPTQVQFFHELGSALEQRGSTKEAERQYQAAANLNPTSVAAWSELLEFYGRHPDRPSAIRQVCDRLTRSKLAPSIYSERCDRLLRGVR